jgi:hypothetical protein
MGMTKPRSFNPGALCCFRLQFPVPLDPGQCDRCSRQDVGRLRGRSLQLVRRADCRPAWPLDQDERRIVGRFLENDAKLVGAGDVAAG